MQGRLVVESYVKAFILMYLMYQTYKDIKEKSVSLKSIIIFSLLSGVIDIVFTNMTFIDMILGIGVGLCVILIGKIMRDGIGAGDGAVLSSIGILIGGKSCLLVFIMAITIFAFVAIILLIFKWVKMKQELPFIPYILCAYMLTLL